METQTVWDAYLETAVNRAEKISMETRTIWDAYLETAVDGAEEMASMETRTI